MSNVQAHARKRVEEIVASYKDLKTPMMLILSDIQNEFGYVPLEVQEIVSELTGVPVAEIFGVITFYSLFSLTPKGKTVIGVCLGTACYVKGAQQILDKFEEVLGIKGGQTTADGEFTIDVLRCIGACGLAPAISINKEVHAEVKVTQVAEIVKKYRTGGAA